MEVLAVQAADLAGKAPKPWLLGNAAWLLLHTCPYAVESLDVAAGDAHEDAARFARDYAALVRALVATYPCAACRRHGVTALEPAIAALEAAAAAVRPGDARAAVADMLAMHAMRLHNQVRRSQVERAETDEDEELMALHHEAMLVLERALDQGAVQGREVAQALRSRWAPFR